MSPTGTGAGVVGFLGASDDGQTVYFAATANLTDEAAEHDDVVGPKLYRWRSGDVKYITTLEPPGISFVTELNWVLYKEGEPRASRVSPDGRYLLFTSTLPVPPTASDAPRPKQLYLHDAETDTTRCISCVPGESEPTHPATLSEFGNFSFSGAPTLVNALLPDGRAIFNTAHALVPEDGNARVDVYLWDPDAGAARLISSGQSTDDSFFVDASGDGRDILFVTRERLVGTDTDNNMDLYDARVGGGFEGPRAAPAECVGDACQGALSVAPSPGHPPTATIATSGNVVAEASPTFHLGRLTARQLRRASRTGVIRLAVRTNDAGLLVARATARIPRSGPVRVVARDRKRLRRAGSTEATLRLSPLARRALRRSGQLNVTVHVRFGDTGRWQRRVVRLVMSRRGVGKGAARSVRSAVEASK